MWLMDNKNLFFSFHVSSHEQKPFNLMTSNQNHYNTEYLAIKKILSLYFNSKLQSSPTKSALETLIKLSRRSCIWELKSSKYLQSIIFSALVINSP